jgi:hypothetical protein
MMRKMAVIAAAGMALSGCSVSHDKSAAEAGVASFHQMMDAGRYHDIYVGSAPEFRQSAPEPQAIAVLQRVHDRLGAFRSGTQSGWRVNFNTGGTIVNFTYNTQFASAAGTEDFVFRVNGETTTLVGYHVNSPALLESAAPTPAASKPGEAGAPESSVTMAPVPPQPSGGK